MGSGAHSNRKARLWTAATIAAVVTAFACGIGDQEGEPSTVDTPTVTAPGQTEAPGTAAIGSGQGYTYQDGLQVVVPSAEQFDPSSSAAGVRPGDEGVVVTVTLVNGTGNTIDLALTTVSLRAGSQGEEAETIVDLEKGIDIGFTGKIAPQRRATATFGFSVPAENFDQIDVEVSPGLLDYQGVLFSGEVS